MATVTFLGERWKFDCVINPVSLWVCTGMERIIVSCFNLLAQFHDSWLRLLSFSLAHWLQFGTRKSMLRSDGLWWLVHLHGFHLAGVSVIRKAVIAGHHDLVWAELHMCFFAHHLIFSGEVVFLVTQAPHAHILVMASISADPRRLYRQLVVASGRLERLVLLDFNLSDVMLWRLRVMILDIAVLDWIIVPSLARSVKFVQVLLANNLLEIAISLELLTRLIDLWVFDQAVLDVSLPHGLYRLLDLQSIYFFGLDALLLGRFSVVGLALDLLSMLARVEGLAQMLRACEWTCKWCTAVWVLQAASHRLTFCVRFWLPSDHSYTVLWRDGILHHCLVRLVEMGALWVVAGRRALLRRLFHLHLLRFLLKFTRILWIERAVSASEEMRHIFVLCFHVKDPFVTRRIVLDTEVADLIEKLFCSDASYSLELSHIFLNCWSAWLAFIALLSLQRCVFLCHKSWTLPLMLVSSLHRRFVEPVVVTAVILAKVLVKHRHVLGLVFNWIANLVRTWILYELPGISSLWDLRL